jgi:hypothetical protein
MGLKSGEYGGRYNSLGTTGFDQRADTGHFVCGQVVQDHDIPSFEPRTEYLFHVGQENIAIGGCFHGHGRADSAQAQSGQ